MTIMNIREYLQQTEFAGTTLYQIAIWIFIAACVLLAIMLLRRLFRWITGGSSSKSTPATKTQPLPEMQRDRDQPAVTLTSDDSRQSFARSADSLLKDETSGDQRVLAPAEDSIFRDERDEIDEPMPVLSSEESMVKESSQPQRTFQVASSKETREYTGKQRSWTSRSLFGKPITGQQVDLPRVSSSDIPFADRGDYRYGSNLTPALASLMPETDERKAALKKDLIQ
ncbi:MAG TPA: hypothetical protein DD473_25390, partial [Planctomycetaceae bacterium]|nr:hypothetical protein [Planctomycetaceae bacterium]